MLFPAEIVSHGFGWMVSFPDIPEAVTLGGTRETALESAKHALQSALQDYFVARREVPQPSEREKNQVVVELSTRAAAKVLLLNEMVRQGVRPIELARRLGTTSQEASPDHPPPTRNQDRPVWRRTERARKAPCAADGLVSGVPESHELAGEYDVHAIGISTLAAGHTTLVPAIIEELTNQGADDIIVFVDGVAPQQDYEFLYNTGVKGIYGPRTPILDSAKHVLEQVRIAMGEAVRA